MKKLSFYLILLLTISVLFFASSVSAAKKLQPIVKDNFNKYLNGSIVSQGGWVEYVNGANFTVEDSTSFEGQKALFNNALADSVVAKAGTPLADGKQAVRIRTENRASWGFYEDGNAQFRVTKGVWGTSGKFAAVSFRGDGNVAYYDPITDDYLNFASYNDNEWTLLEVEWRSSDAKARYRVNNGEWTDWKTFAGTASFTNFDHVGFDFFLPSGSGGVYYDTLR